MAWRGVLDEEMCVLVLGRSVWNGQWLESSNYVPNFALVLLVFGRESRNRCACLRTVCFDILNQISLLSCISRPEGGGGRTVYPPRAQLIVELTQIVLGVIQRCDSCTVFIDRSLSIALVFYCNSWE